ncbi:unnamed protein product, partial [marine sediment metagenome]
LVHGNSFYGTIYIDNKNLSNYFNTTVGGVGQGNYYEDILTRDIFDTTGNGFGNSGTEYPYNGSLDTWIGLGGDYGPVGASSTLGLTIRVKDVFNISGGVATFTYSLTGAVNTTCNLTLDSTVISSIEFPSGLFEQNYSHAVTTGVHEWYLKCYYTQNPETQLNSSLRTFTAQIASYPKIINISDASQNVRIDTQSMFFEVNGNLTVLYFSDDNDTFNLNIKIIDNTTVTSSYMLPANLTKQFFVTMRTE